MLEEVLPDLLQRVLAEGVDQVVVVVAVQVEAVLLAPRDVGRAQLAESLAPRRIGELTVAAVASSTRATSFR